MNILEEISKKGSDKEKIAEQIIRNPGLLSEVFDGLNAEKAAAKYGCGKVLRVISGKNPKILYPKFDFFVKMLDSENNFLKWGAIITISNLAAIDTKNKFEKIFKKYFTPITGKTMITASNIIGNSWKIALAKPKLTEKVTREVLKSEEVKYEHEGRISPECNNVVCGQAIDSFGKFYEKIKNKKPVVNFMKKQLNNTRKSVVKKAEKFIKKYKI
ncbi:MAG: hypothetical protein ABIH68_05645 [bacterium]